MVLLLSGVGGARGRGVAWSILLLAVLSFGAAVEGQRPAGGQPGRAPAAAARRRAVLVGHVAVRSLDAMEDLAEEVGVVLPPMLTAAGLEGQLPFLGKGSLATDQPAGMVIFAVPGVVEESGLAFVLPVNPGKATVESFVQLGGRRVEGRGDVVMLNARLFRRTDRYLVFGSPDDGVLALDDAVIAGAMKEPAAVARLVVDLKSMKHTRPRSYDEFFERALRNAGATRGEQAGAQLAIDFVKGLDGLT